MKLYRRFFKYIDHNSKYINDFFHYIDDSTRHIDLPTHNDKIKAPNHFEVNPENGTLIKTPKPLVP